MDSIPQTDKLKRRVAACCFVYGCDGQRISHGAPLSGKEKLRFFGFPKQTDVRFHEWVKFCGRDDGEGGRLYPTSQTVCERHFDPTDIVKNAYRKPHKALKKWHVTATALPVYFPGHPSYGLPRPPQPQETVSGPPLFSLLPPEFPSGSSVCTSSFLPLAVETGSRVSADPLIHTLKNLEDSFRIDGVLPPGWIFFKRRIDSREFLSAADTFENDCDVTNVSSWHHKIVTWDSNLEKVFQVNGAVCSPEWLTYQNGPIARSLIREYLHIIHKLRICPGHVDNLPNPTCGHLIRRTGPQYSYCKPCAKLIKKHRRQEKRKVQETQNDLHEAKKFRPLSSMTPEQLLVECREARSSAVVLKRHLSRAEKELVKAQEKIKQLETKLYGSSDTFEESAEAEVTDLVDSGPT